MLKKTYIIVLCAVLMLSCNQKNNSDEVVTEEPTIAQPTAKETINVVGLYQGISVDENGEEIKIEITLTEDEMYTQTTQKLSSNQSPEKDLGDYTWLEDGNTLSLEGINSDPILYLVSENKLTPLDQNRQPISQFELKKIN